MMGDWTLFSNHGHVLVCLARNREARLRDVASDIGITERAVQKIVHELQSAGFVTISKHGRCNRYEINTRKNLRHALEAQCTVGRLLQLFSKQASRSSKHQDEVKGEPEAPSAQPPVVRKDHSASITKKEPAGATSPPETSEPPDSRNPDTRKQGSLF
jgi:hypothetical protein